MQLAPLLVEPPAALPVDLAYAREHCRIDHVHENAIVQTLIDAATQRLDGWSGILGRALITQTWRQDLPRFPADGVIRLPLAPVQSISSVTYRDADDAVQTLAAAAYAGPLADALGPYIYRPEDVTWPATYDRPAAVSVTFVAGYGPQAAALPAPIRQAILLMVGHWYEHREATGRSLSELPMGLQALIAPYRRVGF